MDKLSEQIDVEYDKADALDRRRIIHRDTLRSWKSKVAQLEAKLERLDVEMLTTDDEGNPVGCGMDLLDWQAHLQTESGVERLHTREIESTNAALLDVVKDCVNFLADLNSTSPFDSEYMAHRAKALHKCAYTAHSKAKEK